MVDILPIITASSTIVLIIGGIYTIREQIKKRQEESDRKIISAIKQEINPIQTDLQTKETAINDLWKEIERLEDKLNKLQIEAARSAGFIDVQTPLMKEIRDQITILHDKIENIQIGLNSK